MINGLLFLEKWQEEICSPSASSLFVRVLNLVGFLLILWMLPIADQVWGSDHFVIVTQSFEGIGRYAMLLREPFFRDHYWWFIIPFLLITGTSVLGFTNAPLRLITWVLFVNIHYANFEISNGGWHLLHHLFLLSIFLFRVKDDDSSKLASVQRLLHNLGFNFIWIQISILYMTAGFHKLLGTYWLNGEALMLTMSMEEFSLPYIMRLAESNTWYFKLGTWISLFYQISFPFLIWFKKVRPVLLAIGLVFHLSIAFIVGVTDFGLILVGMYSIFVPEYLARRWIQLDPVAFVRRKMAGIKIISGTGD